MYEIHGKTLIFTFILLVAGEGTFCRSVSQKELQLELVKAIERDQLSIVNELLVKGIQLDCIILFNKTPLTYAIESEAFDIAKTLVKSGADVNAREPIASARQPVHVAVDFPGHDILEFLLQHGADVNGRDGCGATPIMLASYAGHLEAVQLLHAHGADLTAHDFVGRTALHRAAERQHDSIMRFLLANNADIDARDQFGWTAIYHSIVFGHVGTIKFLLASGISVNGTDCNNRSPLTVACNRLCPPNLRVVLSTALDFYKRQRKIPTSALHMVMNSEDCTNRELVIMELLINAGAHLNVTRLTDFFCLCPNLALQGKQPLLHYLVVCGCVWAQEDFNIAASFPYVPQLHLWVNKQRSLQHLSRIAVRTHLFSMSHCRDIHSAVHTLPVPLALKKFLNLSDFADMYPGFLPDFGSPHLMQAEAPSM